jgi:hypothetical protein
MVSAVRQIWDTRATYAVPVANTPFHSKAITPLKTLILVRVNRVTGAIFLRLYAHQFFITGIESKCEKDR